MTTWVLRGASTEYAVRLPEHQQWLEMVAWGPHGVSGGPAALADTGPTNFLTDADVAALEYGTDQQRTFTGLDLIVDGGVRWLAREIDAAPDRLSARFVDEHTGLSAVLHYRFHPGTDVIERHIELANDGAAPVRLLRAGSAAFCLPTPTGARLSYLRGQWSQEFQPAEIDLLHGHFSLASSQGLPGHGYAPWLTVADRASTPAWGVALAWSGSWEITAEADATGMTRVRAGRSWRNPIELAAGDRLTLPIAAGTYSSHGPAGVTQAWHTYERAHAQPRHRPVVYNSWEATGFAVHAGRQLELARLAADLGVETFVVDDGWFTDRNDDRGGLGTWQPDPAKFPDGLDAFINDINDLGLNFGLWIEPEAVSPGARLYAEHPTGSTAPTAVQQPQSATSTCSTSAAPTSPTTS